MDCHGSLSAIKMFIPIPLGHVVLFIYITIENVTDLHNGYSLTYENKRSMGAVAPLVYVCHDVCPDLE